MTGDEPEKTNKFLVSFHKAATSGKDFAKYIKKYKDYIDKKGKEKQPETKEPVKEKPVEKEITKKQEVKKEEPAVTDDKVKKQRPESPKEKKSQNAVVAEKTKPKEPEKKKEEKKEEKKEVVKDVKENNKENNDDNNDNTDLGLDKGNKIIMTGKVGSKIKEATKKQVEDKGVIESSRTKSNLNLKDLESIKNNIHEISLNANPIGKLIDYLPEDIESMNKELYFWINESKGFKEKFEEEVKKSEEILLPLENEYVELEETIKDEIMRIKSIKSRILKNEIVIQNLINGVISVKNIN